MINNQFQGLFDRATATEAIATNSPIFVERIFQISVLLSLDMQGLCAFFDGNPESIMDTYDELIDFSGKIRALADLNESLMARLLVCAAATSGTDLAS